MKSKKGKNQSVNFTIYRTKTGLNRKRDAAVGFWIKDDLGFKS